MDAEAARVCGEFLVAWKAWTDKGLDGLRLIYGPEVECTVEFVQACTVMDAEMGRLEFESDVADALADAQSRRT